MYRYTKSLTFLLAALIASACSSSVSADILLNPGFENGTGTDADDWTEISGPAGSTTRISTMQHSGSSAAYMEIDHINNPAAGAAYFIEQNQGANTINNNLNYNLSFWAKTDSTDFTGINMFVQMLWLDQDGSDGGGVKGEMLTSLIGLQIDTNYQQFLFNDLDAPDGADSFLLRFQLSAGAVDNIVNGLYIDDTSLTAIPEPTTLGLIALGGLGVVLRRRRS